MCQCKGEVICDACASRQIDALNAVTPDFVELLPGMLTEDEFAEVLISTSAWLDSLKTSEVPA